MKLSKILEKYKWFILAVLVVVAAIALWYCWSKIKKARELAKKKKEELEQQHNEEKDYYQMRQAYEQQRAMQQQQQQQQQRPGGQVEDWMQLHVTDEPADHQEPANTGYPVDKPPPGSGIQFQQRPQVQQRPGTYKPAPGRQQKPKTDAPKFIQSRDTRDSMTRGGTDDGMQIDPELAAAFADDGVEG